MSGITSVYTINQFAEFFSGQNKYIVPGNQTVEVQQVNPLLYWRYNCSATPEEQQSYFIEIISDILLPLGKRLASISSEGSLRLSCGYNDDKKSISFSGDQEIVMTADQSTLVTTIPRLFERMVSTNLLQLKLVPNQALLFKNLPEEDLAILAKKDNGVPNTTRVLAYFLSYSSESIIGINMKCSAFGMEFPEKIPRSFAILGRNSELNFTLNLKDKAQFTMPFEGLSRQDKKEGIPQSREEDLITIAQMRMARGSYY